MKIAIIEDDAEDKQHLGICLSQYLKSIEADYTVDSFSSVDEYPLETQYDLVFVDIMIREKNGFDLARKIREKFDAEITSIVFTTTLSQYAIEGYELGAASYILKPFTYHDFVIKTINVFKKLKTRENHQISLYTRDKQYVNLDLASIYYIESSAHYLTYYTKKGNFEVRQSMSECEKNFAGKGFVRINSWYLISLRHVEQVLQDEVIINGHTLAISRSRKKTFLEEFTKSYGI